MPLVTATLNVKDWSWKQAVADQVFRIVNERSSLDFKLEDLYDCLSVFHVLFPQNKHPKEKIRQVLQRLRDDGVLCFVGSGRYSINLANADVCTEPAPLGISGVEIPATRQVVRNIRLRCTLLATEIKRRYRDLCQVCRQPVCVRDGKCFSEAHHLHPLGSPHFGPDVPGNIIVLCPNHHVMFDRCAATIVPDSLIIRHVSKNVFLKDARLYVEPWHVLSEDALRYHHKRMRNTPIIVQSA